MGRLHECRIFSAYPLGVPTLRGFPPPAPVPRAATPRFYRPASPSPLPQALPVRSRRHRMFHDCIFFPEPGAARAFFGPRQDLVPPARHRARSRRWDFEGPLVVGALLMLLPPIGVTALWASRRFSLAAKAAVTAYATALTLLIAILLGRA